MKWLLGVLGLTIYRHRDIEDAMARVRTASDDHTREAASATERVEDVIFNTRQSALLTAIDIQAPDDRQRVLEELLANKVRQHVPFRR